MKPKTITLERWEAMDKDGRVYQYLYKPCRTDSIWHEDDEIDSELASFRMPELDKHFQARFPDWTKSCRKVIIERQLR